MIGSVLYVIIERWNYIWNNTEFNDCNIYIFQKLNFIAINKSSFPSI